MPSNINTSTPLIHHEDLLHPHCHRQYALAWHLAGLSQVLRRRRILAQQRGSPQLRLRSLSQLGWHVHWQLRSAAAESHVSEIWQLGSRICCSEPEQRY